MGVERIVYDSREVEKHFPVFVYKFIFQQDIYLISALIYIYIPANFEVRIKSTPLTRVGLGMSHCTCAVGAEIAYNSIQTFF